MAGKRITLRAASATALAASSNSSDVVSRNARGLTVAVKIVSATGTTPTVTVKLQGKTLTGDYYDIAGATTAALAGNTPATTFFTVYPGMTVAANAGVSAPAPGVYRLVYTLGGTTPVCTFAADVIEHP